MARVAVAGGAGKPGRACVAHLLEHGWDVVTLDRVPPVPQRGTFVRADLTSYGQAAEALTAVDDRYRRNADTVMSRPNRELLAEVFPDVPVRGEIGEHETLLSIDKARRVLGYQPRHSWRDEVRLPG